MSLNSPDLDLKQFADTRIAIVAAAYNQTLVDALIDRATETLQQHGVSTPTIERVPGSAELPTAAALLAASGDFDAVIAIGVVIAGDTNHHNIIGDSTASALQHVSLTTGIPAINGILVVNNQAQAEARAGDEINRGKEFAEAALHMSAFKKKWTKNQSL